jgi:hypothetical protein
MRIGGEAPGRRAQSRNRCQHHGLLRVTATSDRHRIPTVFCSSCSESLSEFSSHAARNTTPAGTSPMVTRRHRAMSNLRASATIIVLRFLPVLSVLVRYHRANALSFWKTKKRQANWIIPRRTRAFPALASPFSCCRSRPARQQDLRKRTRRPTTT